MAQVSSFKSKYHLVRSSLSPEESLFLLMHRFFKMLHLSLQQTLSSFPPRAKQQQQLLLYEWASSSCLAWKIVRMAKIVYWYHGEQMNQRANERTHVYLLIRLERAKHNSQISNFGNETSGPFLFPFKASQAEQLFRNPFFIYSSLGPLARWQAEGTKL